MGYLVRVCAVLVLVAGCGVASSLQHRSRPLAKSAAFDVCIVSPTKTAGCKVATNPDSGGPLFLEMPPVISAADVDVVQLSTDSANQSAMRVRLTAAGAAKLAKATAAPIQVAIQINGTVVMTVGTKSPLSQAFEIAGDNIAKNGEKWFRELTE